MRSEAYQRFLASYDRVHGLSHVGRALEGKALGSVDMSEAFRAEIVLAVSAWDSYVHNLCVEAIYKSFLGSREKNKHYGEARICLSSAEQLASGGSTSWVEGEVRAQFSRDTFQRADDIAKALRFVDDRPKRLARVAASMTYSSEVFRQRLNAIVDRRNMIVHEADIDPVWGSVRPIGAEEAEEASGFLLDCVVAIEAECWEPHNGE